MSFCVTLISPPPPSSAIVIGDPCKHELRAFKIDMYKDVALDNQMGKTLKLSVFCGEGVEVLYECICLHVEGIKRQLLVIFIVTS